jgi:hypothetical protein
MKTFKQAY